MLIPRSVSIEEALGPRPELAATLRSHAEMLRRAGRPQEAAGEEARAAAVDAQRAAAAASPTAPRR